MKRTIKIESKVCEKVVREAMDIIQYTNEVSSLLGGQKGA